MLVNWIRFFLFMAILAVLAVAALLHWDRGDQDIMRALRRGAEQARQDALAIGRETSETLVDTAEVVNKQSRKLRADSEGIRRQISEAGRAQQQELAERQEAVLDQVEEIETEALSWKDKLLAGLDQAAARLRAWWEAQAGDGES